MARKILEVAERQRKFCVTTRKKKKNKGNPSDTEETTPIKEKENDGEVLINAKERPQVSVWYLHGEMGWYVLIRSDIHGWLGVYTGFLDCYLPSYLLSKLHAYTHTHTHVHTCTCTCTCRVGLLSCILQSTETWKLSKCSPNASISSLTLKIRFSWKPRNKFLNSESDL